jgi:hypothetical protein
MTLKSLKILLAASGLVFGALVYSGPANAWHRGCGWRHQGWHRGPVVASDYVAPPRIVASDYVAPAPIVASDYVAPVNYSAPLVVAVASGNYCATSVRTCLLQEPGVLGTGCSCHIPGGIARGLVE